MASKIDQYSNKKTDSKKSGNEKEEQTKSSSSYLLYIATIVAVLGAIASTTQLDSLNDFIDEFSTHLCASSLVSDIDEVANETKSSNYELRLSSKFDPLLKDGEAYNALNAIKSRSKAFKQLCHFYSDKMRSESKITTTKPTDRSAFIYYPTKSFAVCTIPGVASKAVTKILSFGDANLTHNQKEAASAYPKIMETLKKVILVRHPMERLVSVYKNTFGPRKDGDKDIEAKASFKEFMNIVINGYYELEVYLSKENMKHHSGAIDTGMIDGVSGISKKWNTYWRTCGVCHLHFKPEYILHMEHFKDDIKVVTDDLMDQQKLSEEQQKNIKSFLEMDHDVESQDPATLELYYSQLTKSDIRKLYEKYRVDFDLFGYTPDYFIKFGKGY